MRTSSWPYSTASSSDRVEPADPPANGRDDLHGHAQHVHVAEHVARAHRLADRQPGTRREVADGRRRTPCDRGPAGHAGVLAVAPPDAPAAPRALARGRRSLRVPLPAMPSPDRGAGGRASRLRAPRARRARSADSRAISAGRILRRATSGDRRGRPSGRARHLHVLVERRLVDLVRAACGRSGAPSPHAQRPCGPSSSRLRIRSVSRCRSRRTWRGHAGGHEGTHAPVALVARLDAARRRRAR